MKNENSVIRMAKEMVSEQFYLALHYSRELNLPYIEEHCIILT